MRTIETQLEIVARAARIWQVLTDFPRYPEWNPFIMEIEGVPEIGARLRVRIQPPGHSVVAARDRELRWVGHLFLPRIFDGEHSFLIENRGRNCRFQQSKRFSGVLVPIFGAGIFDPTQRGVEAMNSALKARTETA
jgi:hypothetical protein